MEAQNMTHPFLELRDTDISYDNKIILEKINFLFKPSSIYVLSGPSGIGKTSLMKTVSAHQRPQKGQVLLNGKPHLTPSKSIFYIQQEDDLFDWLTVLGHIQLCQKQGGDLEEGLRLAKELELNADLHLYPSQLSLGMKKRLAILRALMMKPKILILDETLSSVETRLRDKIILLLEDWTKKTAAACIFVTHYPMDFQTAKVHRIKIQNKMLMEQD